MDQATETELRRIAGSATVFAALGVLLKLREQPGVAGEETRAALTRIVDTALPGLLDTLGAEDGASLLHLITVQLGDAHDLLHGPERVGRWAFEDQALLQALGDFSRVFPRHFAALAKDRPDFAFAFSERFLDVGTGVASLALEAAAQFPALRVVGLDIWGPSLALARGNVAASPFADRVEIRQQDVTTLDEPAAYGAAWLPVLFFPTPVVEAAVPRLVAALRPGGLLIIPRGSVPTDTLPAAIAGLTRLRQGGGAWSNEALIALLERSGLVDAALIECPRFVLGGRYHLLVGRKPD